MSDFSVKRVGTSLAVLGVVSYVLCVLWDLLVPASAMRSVWAAALPGFSWSAGGVLIGFVEVIAYAYYAAVIFVPAYRWLGRPSRSTRSGGGPSVSGLKPV
jgi:hypothetical protein